MNKFETKWPVFWTLQFKLYLDNFVEDIFFMLVKECQEAALVFTGKYEKALEDVSKIDTPRLFRVLRIPDEII